MSAEPGDGGRADTREHSSGYWIKMYPRLDHRKNMISPHLSNTSRAEADGNIIVHIFIIILSIRHWLWCQRKSPGSITLLQFILTGTWTSEQHFITIHPIVVELFQSEPENVIKSFGFLLWGPKIKVFKKTITSMWNWLPWCSVPKAQTGALKVNRRCSWT